jgi:type IV pilus assembly protein PilO
MATDLKQLGDSLSGQFRNLNGVHPGMWPILPRLLCGVAVAAVVVTAGYFGYWQGQFEEQDVGAQEEVKLRDEYKQKTAQAVNLEALKVQKEKVDTYVLRLEKQLPGKAEMASLLSDINQAGAGRSLSFDSFKPGKVDVKDYYAEQPIEIRVTGSYHDVGAFAGDMASMPRIVTLNNMKLEAGKDNSTLTLEAVAKTFRYLDPEEVAASRKAAAEKKKAEKKK